MFTQLSTASRMTLEPWGSGSYWTMLSYYPSLYLLSSIFWEDSVLGRQLWEDQVLGRQLVSPTHLTNTQWKVCLKSDASRLFTHHSVMSEVTHHSSLTPHHSGAQIFAALQVCKSPASFQTRISGLRQSDGRVASYLARTRPLSLAFSRLTAMSDKEVATRHKTTKYTFR